MYFTFLSLTYKERQFIEMMCNGEFLQKDPDQAIEYLDDLVEKALGLDLVPLRVLIGHNPQVTPQAHVSIHKHMYLSS